MAERWGMRGTQPSGQVLEVSPRSQGLLAAPTYYIRCSSCSEGTDGKGSTSFSHLLRDAFNLSAHGHSSHMTSSHNGCGRGYWAVSLLLGNVFC